MGLLEGLGEGEFEDVDVLAVVGEPAAGDPDEAAMKRTLAGRAADTYVLASSEKIGAASPFTVLPLDKTSGIITDAPPQDPVLEQLRHTGLTIVQA